MRTPKGPPDVRGDLHLRPADTCGRAVVGGCGLFERGAYSRAAHRGRCALRRRFRVGFERGACRDNGSSRTPTPTAGLLVYPQRNRRGGVPSPPGVMVSHTCMVRIKRRGRRPRRPGRAPRACGIIGRVRNRNIRAGVEPRPDGFCALFGRARIVTTGGWSCTGGPFLSVSGQRPGQHSKSVSI